MMMDENRLIHIDWLRAVGIVLVVYGHSLADVPDPVFNVIYAFHMPLFFFLSGAVLRNEKLALPLSDYIKNQSHTLLRPYFVSAVIWYVVWLLVLRHHGMDAGQPIPAVKPLLAIAYGSAGADDLLQPVHLWFLPCLFVCRMLLYGLVRLQGIARLAGVAFSIAAGLLLRRYILPWELETALIAVVFVVAGYHMTLSREKWTSCVGKVPLFIAPLLLLAAVYLSDHNVRVDMRIARIGNPFLFFVVSFLFMFSLYRIALILPRVSAIEAVSKSILSVFLFHPMVFTALSGFYVFVLHVPLSIRESNLVGVLASLLAVFALTVLNPWITRMLLGRGGRPLFERV